METIKEGDVWYNRFQRVEMLRKWLQLRKRKKPPSPPTTDDTASRYLKLLLSIVITYSIIFILSYKTPQMQIIHIVFPSSFHPLSPLFQLLALFSSSSFIHSPLHTPYRLSPISTPYSSYQNQPKHSPQPTYPSPPYIHSYQDSTYAWVHRQEYPHRGNKWIMVGVDFA